MLTEHRKIVGGHQKELRFFLNRQNWDDPDYRSYRRPCRPWETRAGDATPAYLYFPGAIERMHRYNPEMKLIASFRDSIERAFSHWAMERRRQEGLPDLPEAIDRHGTDPLPAPLPPGAGAWEILRGSPFPRGLYGAQLERALAFFPREQWLLVEFGELLREPHAVLDRATDLLELHRFRRYPELGKRMATPTSNPGRRPSVAQVERLVRHYADDLALFERLSGLDVTGWPTHQVIAGSLDVTELRDRLCDKLGLQP